MKSLHDDRYFRIKQIVKPNGILPVSASTWWAGVKSGRFPAPIKLGPRITAWRGADINALLAQLTQHDTRHHRIQE